jgi:hypothetical protein
LASFCLHRKFDYQSHAVEDKQVISLLIKLNKNLKKIRKALMSGPDIQSAAQDPVLSGYNPDDWCLLEDALKITRASKSSIYRYRRQHLIRTDKVAGIVKYYIPDLLRLKYKCMK